MVHLLSLLVDPVAAVMDNETNIKNSHVNTELRRLTEAFYIQLTAVRIDVGKENRCNDSQHAIPALINHSGTVLQDVKYNSSDSKMRRAPTHYIGNHFAKTRFCQSQIFQ